jgi:multicomponent Na+:H+ antiporter subunit D
MTLLPALPMLAALGAAVLGLLTASHPRLQRAFSLVGAAVHLAASCLLLATVRASGPQVLQMGSWAAPFGISMAVDLFGALLLVATGIIYLGTLIYSQRGLSPELARFQYFPLVSFLVFGVSGAFTTGDLFNLYVCYEILLISSFGLLVLGNSKAQLRGAVKYLVLNLLASAFFLVGSGLLYGQVGTLNLAQLAERVGAMAELPPQLRAVGWLLFTGFAIKAGLFPLFFWLPASYHTPAPAVSALFSGLLTKVGLYSIFRLFSLVFPQQDGKAFPFLVLVAILSMWVGVLGAVSRGSVRRILSVHIISQVGYVLLGFALFSDLAVAAAIFFMLHTLIAKTGLFFAAGVIEDLNGSGELKDAGGLARQAPWLAFFFFVLALALAGLPPLSGFFAKFVLARAAMETHSFGSLAAVVLVSVLTLFSMLKIWNEVFWKPRPAGLLSSSSLAAESIFGPRLVVVAAFAALVTAMGLGARPLFGLCQEAARGLTDPSAYVRAVLGAGR